MATTKEGSAPEKGRVGNVTYYQWQGQTIMRTAHNNRIKKGRTTASLERRTKMSNLINCWRQVKPVLADCFEDRKPTASEYNAFISLNINRSQVCLAKEESVSHVAVAENFVVSHGTMEQPVQASREEGRLVSDLAVEPLPKGLDSSMLELGMALLRGNPGRLQWDDRIRYVRLQQRFGLDTHSPFVSAYSFEMPLTQADRRTVGQFMAGVPFAEGFDFAQGRLAAPLHDDSFSCWIILRPRRKGRPQVSTQHLQGHTPTLERYSSAAQLEKAILSYGPLEE